MIPGALAKAFPAIPAISTSKRAAASACAPVRAPDRSGWGNAGIFSF